MRCLGDARSGKLSEFCIGALGKGCGIMISVYFSDRIKPLYSCLV